MKTLTTFSFILFITVFGYARPFPTNALSHSPVTVVKTTAVFGTFHVHRQGDFASLNWNADIQGVSAFAIERSYDGEYFDMIDAVSPDPSKWNRYTMPLLNQASFTIVLWHGWTMEPLNIPQLKQ